MNPDTLLYAASGVTGGTRPGAGYWTLVTMNGLALAAAVALAYPSVQHGGWTRAIAATFDLVLVVGHGVVVGLPTAGYLLRGGRHLTTRQGRVLAWLCGGAWALAVVDLTLAIVLPRGGIC
jgi:hypothetical protein